MTDQHSEIIGKTVDEAKSITGMTIRSVMINGNPVVVTRDYRTDRINVELLDGKIVRVRGIG